MQPTAPRIFAACLLCLLACALPPGAGGQSRQPAARKFDEYTESFGSASARRYYVDYATELKARETRLRRYAAQLRKEGARPYAITYGPRVVGWEVYGRSVAGMLASGLWPHLTGAGFDWRHINWVNGGFREEATTELWVVPPGAQPPCPTPSVRPEEVVYCPRVYVEGATYVPAPTGPLRFKADVKANDRRVSPTFSWEVSRGRIDGGQGTDTVTVELPQGVSGEVVARVLVGGYSLECPADSSAAHAKTAVGLSHFLLDEFGDIRSGDTKARLDNLALELQNDPTLQTYLVVYGGRNGPRGQAARRAFQLKSYLTETRGVDPARVFTVEGGFRDELSGELWLSPPGAPAPPLRPTLEEVYARPKGDVRRKP